MFPELLYVLICYNILYCNQVISMLIIIIYGDGLAQRFVVELDGGLVMDDTIIEHVNKLTTIVALLHFSSEVFTIS